MSWYTPSTRPDYTGSPLPDRRGHQIGPFILVNLEVDAYNQPTHPHWQLDHWPTGYCILREVPYNRARSWMSRHATDPNWRFVEPPAKHSPLWYDLKAQVDQLR